MPDFRIEVSFGEKSRAIRRRSTTTVPRMKAFRLPRNPTTPRTGPSRPLKGAVPDTSAFGDSPKRAAPRQTPAIIDCLKLTLKDFIAIAVLNATITGGLTGALWLAADSRIDSVESRVARLEARVDGNSERLARVEAHLEAHGQALARIEALLLRQAKH